MSKPTHQQVNNAQAVIEYCDNDELLRLCIVAMTCAVERGISHEAWAFLDSEEGGASEAWYRHFTEGTI